ncbi:1082_t:CDS:1, partial [Funneliformis caledonium]
MGHQQHFLTPYIVVLHSEQRVNKSNKYAICCACINILEKEEAYKNKFTNTKKECMRHFRNCSSFTATYTSEQINKLLNKAEKNGAKSNKPIKKRSCIILDDLASDEESDFETETDINIKPSYEYENEIIPIQNQNVLDNYIFRPLTTSQISKLEEFLLEVTVSCGFPFQWIENDAVKRFFHWLNPMIILPSRK